MPRVSRRADVRATAARLFREHGYRSATMDLIADTVGLNKGTLYHYYASKSAILYELLSEQLDVTLALVEGISPDGRPIDRFSELIRREVAQAASASDELVVFFQELPWLEQNLSPAEASAILERVSRYRTVSEDIIQQGIAAGEFRPVDVAIIHYSIIGTLAYIPNWFRPRPGRSRAMVVDELTEFILSGIVASPAQAAAAAGV